MKTGLSQGAAGSTYVYLDFTNISNVTCTLYGYPGVSFAGGTPVQQIGLAADHNPNPARSLITLAPGAIGSSLLKISQAGNYPPAQCDEVTATLQRSQRFSSRIWRSLGRGRRSRRERGSEIIYLISVVAGFALLLRAIIGRH